MPATRFSPPSLDIKDKSAIRGLLLACALQTRSIQLLLPGCTEQEARAFQDEAKGTLWVIKRNIARAKRV